MAPATPAEITAEFVGTFLLIFTVGCNVLGGTGTWAGVSIACVLMVCIYAFGKISGANFNPAVSFGLGLSQQLGGPGMEWAKVGVYSAVQIIAGIAAGFCYRALFSGAAINLGPSKGFGIVEAVMAELFYTFMLVFVVLNVAAAKTYAQTGNSFYGLAIGFVIVAGAYGAGAISGGCFNPAVALGIDVSSLGFFYSIFYIVAEIAGAAAAVFCFKLVRPTDFDADAAASDTPMMVSEFLGTFMLVLTVGLNVLAKSQAAAYSIAASLMCMIYALGDVSGAHFNPAVSVSIFTAAKLGITSEMPGKELGMRILVQILGGVAAAFTYAGMHHGKSFPLGPAPGFNWMSVTIAEFIFTLVLCTVVLCCAVSEKTAAKQMFGLAIGSCVTVGGFAIGGVSGGSLNPAVSMGIAAAQVLNGGFFIKALAYSGIEFAAGAAAAGLVSVTHGDGAAGEEKLTA